MVGYASTDRSQALELLRRALGNPAADFRPGQWEAIDQIVNHRRKLLVVERTGWGKSSVYFISTRILRDRELGPTLIVSPLLALMRNQQDAAARIGVRAISINSTNRDSLPELRHDVLSGQVDALLISPERLANEEFVQTVLQPIVTGIGLLVVDEAHCISDWGHDFRPDYKRLANILRFTPVNMPVLGTTATANNRVLEDIQSQFPEIQIQRGSLMRESLALQTIRLPDQASRLAWLAQYLPRIPGTGIIYTLTKRDAEQVSLWLNRNSIETRPYYSDIQADGFEDSNDYRQHLEGMLLRNEIKALVATTALGMGYDKPDLGFVIHYQAPNSIISYYQQVGRAGRAIDYAIGVLLAGHEDDQIQEYFRVRAFPGEDDVNRILDELSRSDGLSAIGLQQRLNLTAGQIAQALKFLSVENPAPIILDRGVWRRTPIAYQMDREGINRLTMQRTREWQEVQDYIDSTRCLMLNLASALDDAHAEPCGKCAICLNGPIIPIAIQHPLIIEATRYLQRSELPLMPKRQIALAAFHAYNFRGLVRNFRAETGRILSHWGDAGWGQIVADDKHTNHFRDELVEAVAEMILERWRPNPLPQWVTCVPSRNHPSLVPDFARRLAQRLGLPFLDAVRKTRNNEPQKLQQNRFHQCRNLDGVFDIANGIPNTSVLLVDDVVDSGWTLAIIAARLRQAGSGAVFPIALASTRTHD